MTHLLPVHSSNFSDKFLTKFFPRFSLKLISILPSANLIRFTFFSRSYLSSISFFLEDKEIKSSSDRILSTILFSDKFFKFVVDKSGLACLIFLICSLEVLVISVSSLVE